MPRRVDNRSVSLTPLQITPQVPSQAELRHNATYTVVGGLGGLGRAVVKWMAEHGAKHILSLSRSGTQSGESRVFLNEMKTMGVKLMAYKCDVSSQDEVSNLAEAVSCAGFPPIRGVIQCAMVAKASKSGLYTDCNTNKFAGLYL